MKVIGLEVKAFCIGATKKSSSVTISSMVKIKYETFQSGILERQVPILLVSQSK